MVAAGRKLARDAVAEDAPLRPRRESRGWRTAAELAGVACAVVFLIGLAVLL